MPTRPCGLGPVGLPRALLINRCPASWQCGLRPVTVLTITVFTSNPATPWRHRLRPAGVIRRPSRMRSTVTLPTSNRPPTRHDRLRPTPVIRRPSRLRSTVTRRDTVTLPTSNRSATGRNRLRPTGVTQRPNRRCSTVTLPTSNRSPIGRNRLRPTGVTRRPKRPRSSIRRRDAVALGGMGGAGGRTGRRRAVLVGVGGRGARRAGRAGLGAAGVPFRCAGRGGRPVRGAGGHAPVSSLVPTVCGRAGVTAAPGRDDVQRAHLAPDAPDSAGRLTELARDSVGPGHETVHADLVRGDEHHGVAVELPDADAVVLHRLDLRLVLPEGLPGGPDLLQPAVLTSRLRT